jgi:hypothetical protein
MNDFLRCNLIEKCYLVIGLPFDKTKLIHVTTFIISPENYNILDRQMTARFKQNQIYLHLLTPDRILNESLYDMFAKTNFI